MSRARPSLAPAGRGTPAGRLGLVLSAVALAWAVGARAQPRPVSPDDFIAAAGGADQYEIMAGYVATTESRDPAIRAFAVDMIRDHGAAFEALRQAALRSGLKPPPAIVGGDQRQFLAALQGAREPEFDKLYVRQQRLAHVAALVVDRDYAQKGSDPNLRQAAQADVPMIQRHLRMATALP